ncbi:activator of 90 kDa heat shock protein ATPase homolog 1 [Ischnura elegans]|uniref:activator of 90 kDa heat shock protein ATPase homolog 1 n=1 Tax=Ischnura elegans TaxID=197161 RepID=UPI001ED890EC|nr:activator of 90 kDa heat shock protein ATPase homolog 1 [Ischnura elegans]
MAKWGEGDPRWIVEERPDATNVNNWHWTEKNATAWSVDKLKELFKGLTFEGEGHKCKIYEVDHCEGEASVNNRKGKLIFFYEWDLVLKWKAVLIGQEEEEGKEGEEDKSKARKKTVTKGTIHIPNLSEENKVEEVDVLVSVKESGMDYEKAQKLLNGEGRRKVREQLTLYLSLLKEEYSKGMILPKKGELDMAAQSKPSPQSASEIKQALQNGRPVTSSNAGEKGKPIDTTSIRMKQTFQCTAEDFFRALTQKELVEAFTNGPVVLEPVKGGKFEFFGGNVSGEFMEVTPNTRIAQRWRFKTWPANHYSMVNFQITQKEDHTEVVMNQNGIPLSEVESTKNGWEVYYWSSMKRTLCFGAFVV